MAAAAHLKRLRAALHGPVTLGELASRLGRDGAGLLVLMVALPFLQPIPLAGVGTPLGLLVLAVGIQVARGRETPNLPRFVARRRLEAATVDRLLSAAERALARLERIARARGPTAARSPRALGVGMAAIGLLLALPVFVPFGNPVSAAPLALLGLALLEQDGLLGALGLAGAAFTWAYHAALAKLAWAGMKTMATRFF